MVYSIVQISIEPIMRRLDQKYIDACYDILVEAGLSIHIGSSNEDVVKKHNGVLHKAAQQLSNRGIRVEHIKLMNHGVFAIDYIESPPARKQTSTMCKASSAHIDKKGILQYINPDADKTKNGLSLTRERFGIDMCSRKDTKSIFTSAHAVMATVGRYFMVNFGSYEISPFSALLGKPGQTACTYNLMRGLGIHYLGIPCFGTHSCRTICISLPFKKKVDSGGSLNDGDIDIASYYLQTTRLQSERAYNEAGAALRDATMQPSIMRGINESRQIGGNRVEGKCSEAEHDKIRDLRLGLADFKMQRSALIEASDTLVIVKNYLQNSR